MALAHRIIPTILCRGRQAVKGKGFDGWRSIGTVAEKVRVHQARGVDELILLDIAATAEGRGPDLAMVEELTDCLFAPVAVGGGIRSLQDVRNLLAAGADKVVIGTAAHALTGHALVREIATTVGCQAVCVTMDFRRTERGVLELWTHGGRRRDGVGMGHGPEITAERMVNAGAGELIVQAIELDGTLQGYDLELINRVAGAVDVPVVASSGAGTYAHLAQAIDAGASAVAAGAMFQFTDATPKGAAQYLAKQGKEVRL